jgi:hypothetical protein
MGDRQKYDVMLNRIIAVTETSFVNLGVKYSLCPEAKTVLKAKSIALCKVKFGKTEGILFTFDTSVHLKSYAPYYKFLL